MWGHEERALVVLGTLLVAVLTGAVFGAPGWAEPYLDAVLGPRDED